MDGIMESMQLPLASADAKMTSSEQQQIYDRIQPDNFNVTYDDDGGSVRLDPASDTVETINYVAYNIIAFIIVSVGIVGNILNLVVLSRPKLKGVMYVYLLGLALSNLCVLITAIPALVDIAGNMDSRHSRATTFFQAHLEIPLLNSFMAASVYIIICMTVNRYISIYKPTHFQRFHTFKNAYIAIFFSFVGGGVLHIPLGFAYVVSEDCDEREYNSSATTTECEYSAVPNDAIADHVLFRVYLWVSEALLRLLPIITLTILNILIIVRFHRIAMKREVLKSGAGGHRGSGGCLLGAPSSSNERSSTPIQPAMPSQYTSSSSSSACTHSTGVRSISVSDANGRLSVPALNFGGGTGGCITEDVCSSAVGVSGIVVAGDQTSTSNGLGGIITRAATPVNGSPARLQVRGTPQRASSKRRGLHNPEERMLVVVLIAIVVLFVVCTTPAAFLSIVITENLKKKVWFSIFRACANNLELLCFACNFFVYCLCSADIRRAFVDVLFENCAVKYVRRRSSTAFAGIVAAKPATTTTTMTVATGSSAVVGQNGRSMPPVPAVVAVVEGPKEDGPAADNV